MSIFESIAQGILGGSSSAPGSQCGACAAKDAEIAILNEKVAKQARIIKRQQAVMAHAHAEAHKHEQLGKAGKLLPNPPIKYGKFEGWIDLAKKIKRIL
jgi:hypothetical protein